MANPDIYTIPKSGVYLVAAKTTHCIPTGTFKTVPNKDRKFWQFWKPKTVTLQIYRYEEHLDGQETRHFKKGDQVSINLKPHRLGN